MTLNSVQSECTGYPLAVGSVRGIRTWTVDNLGRLRGVSFNSVWLPGENVATCRRAEAGGGSSYLFSTAWLQSMYADPAARTPPAPPKPDPPRKPCDGNDPECACGFYAYHDGVADYGSKEAFRVIGIIEGWGRATIGTRGFRCEKARVLALARRNKLDTGNRWARLMTNYPDVTWFDKKAEMVAAFPTTEELAPSPESDPTFWDRP